VAKVKQQQQKKCYTTFNQCKFLPLNQTVEKQRKNIWFGKSEGHGIETVKTGNRIQAAEGKSQRHKAKGMHYLKQFKVT
jgi:hypothetical protein